MKYGEKEIVEFDINAKKHYWDNNHQKEYTIDIELPEFMCKCPRSGYPDFATIKLSYCPDKKIIELKALKLYINSFMNRHISHENSANEIFDTLKKNIKPKWIRVVANFNPRGNVHTVITIDSRVQSNAIEFDHVNITSKFKKLEKIIFGGYDGNKCLSCVERYEYKSKL